MTYAGSKSQTGRGSKLSIGGTPTVIGEVTQSGITGAQWGTVDVTNFDSGPDQEFISTVRDNGDANFTSNRVAADAGQVLVEAAFDSGAITAFTLTLPKATGQTTTGDVYSFSALVISRDFSVDTTKAIQWSVKLKISGAVTYTPGT